MHHYSNNQAPIPPHHCFGIKRRSRLWFQPSHYNPGEPLRLHCFDALRLRQDSMHCLCLDEDDIQGQLCLHEDGNTI